MKGKLILKTIFVIVSLLLTSSNPVSGQSGTRNQRPRDINSRSEEIDSLSQGLEGNRNPTPPLTAKLNKTQKDSLKPAREDLDSYATFLKQSDTGLIKLFPDIGCEENGGAINVGESCLKWIPNSAFYSFRRNKYISEFVADIKYANDSFISEGIFGQGMMISLGNVLPESLSLSDGRIRTLASYNPQPKILDVEEDSGKISVDNLEGYQHRNNLPAIENTTYVLRVIAYRGSFRHLFQGKTYDLLLDDTRKDIIVVFRVIGKNTDGSVTILWKELDRKDSPKLNYSKKNED